MKFSIMDATGHSEECYGAGELVSAKEKFDALLRSGHTAAVKGANGEYTVTRILPQEPESELLFVPQLQGG
jgi:hypothetical protein